MMLQSFFSNWKVAVLLAVYMVLMCQNVSASLVDRVVAVVNNDIITLSELNESGREYLERIKEATPADEQEQALREGRQRVLAKLIDQHLVSQEAQKANITISEAELEDNYAKKLDQMGLTREQFLRKLEGSGLSEKKFKDDLRSQLLRDKLVLYEIRSKIIITEAMVEDYFANHYADKLGEGGFYLQQIGITWGGEAAQVDNLTEAAKDRARQKALNIRERLQEGADFEVVARQESDLPSAAEGGDLGIFEEDDLAAYMRDAVLSLEPGEITPVLETPRAFQIFKLVSRQEGEEVEEAAYESVKKEIRQKLFEMEFEKEFRSWVEKIKQEAYIKTMLDD
ncbi:MAG TPA: peptidylprolyl isomerase [Desulfopila sp.]|nr:peptidylprolyl isomerase [Desulfopila sp.]